MKERIAWSEKFFRPLLTDRFLKSFFSLRRDIAWRRFAVKKKWFSFARKDS